MRVIADYAKQSIITLTQPKILLKLVILSSLSSVLPWIVLQYTDLNKFIAFAISVTLFVICYYLLCIAMKVTYKEVFRGLFKGNAFFAKAERFIP